MMKNSGIDYTLIIDGSKLNQESNVSGQDKLRIFKRKIKLDKWKVATINKGQVSRSALGKYDKKSSVLLLMAPDTTYTPPEVSLKQDYQHIFV